MKIYKGEKAEKKILTLAGILTLAATLAVSVTIVLAAANDASQSAETSKATSISIVGKVADTEITTITFPAGLPSATVSVPYNDIDTSSDPQVLHATTSEPVVRLKNTSAGTLNIWLEITNWNVTDALVASEHYELEDPATTTIEVVDDVLSADGTAASVDTSTTIATTAYGALYLQLVLGAEAGKSGTSTLTVLGETP